VDAEFGPARGRVAADPGRAIPILGSRADGFEVETRVDSLDRSDVPHATIARDLGFEENGSPNTEGAQMRRISRIDVSLEHGRLNSAVRFAGFAGTVFGSARSWKSFRPKKYRQICTG